MSEREDDWDSDGQCGSTDTTTGEPCERGPNCPYHGEGDPPDTGRPTKLTHERQERIAAMLEAGHSIGAACRANGISHEAYHSWMRRGSEQDEGIFAEFADRMGRARAEGERQIIEDAREAAIESKNASALLRMAQLQYPESWGDDASGAVAGRGSGGSLNVYLSSDRELETDDYRLVPDDASGVGGEMAGLPDGPDAVSSDADVDAVSSGDDSG